MKFVPAVACVTFLALVAKIYAQTDPPNTTTTTTESTATTTTTAATNTTAAAQPGTHDFSNGTIVVNGRVYQILSGNPSGVGWQVPQSGNRQFNNAFFGKR